MAVENGDVVKVEYIGTFDDGTVFDSSEKSGSLVFKVGSGMIIPGFDQALIGMEIGQEKDIRIQPEDAYGEHFPDRLAHVPKDKFPDPQVEVGLILGIMQEDGTQSIGFIKEITDDGEIIIDMNHPMAGKILNFKFKLLEIGCELPKHDQCGCGCDHDH